MKLYSFSRTGGILIVLLALTLGYCKKPERVLLIKTLDVDSQDITRDKVTLKGELVDIGEFEVFDHGIMYKLTTESDFSEASNGNLSGPKVFSTDIQDPLASSNYYFKAYVKTSGGDYFGEQKSFSSIEASAPTLTTNGTGDIGSRTVLSGGDISDDGGAAITARGVCWGTSDSPTLSDSYTEHTSQDLGHYDIAITGLTPGTHYFVRAFATNIAGTSFGNQQEFTTDAEVPSLTTLAIYNINAHAATSGGENIIENGYTVTEKGICWSTSQLPTVNDFKKVNPTAGTDDFIVDFIDLDAHTKYYVRAYATNFMGTGYGQEVEFTTNIEVTTGTFTDTRDGKDYPWTQIGSQKWMAENLAYLPEVSPSSSLSLTEAHYYVYDYQSTDVPGAKATLNYQNYGVLYNWSAAMAGAEGIDGDIGQIQGVCPDGWHMPTDTEWKNLETFLGMNVGDLDQIGSRGTVGTMLKEEGIGLWTSPNDYADDQAQLHARPGGRLNWDGSFVDINDYAVWWTSTDAEFGLQSLIRSLDAYSPAITRSNSIYDQALSVRCIEGQGYQISEVTTAVPTGITSDGATVGGEVISDGGGATITERGVCWGTTFNPTVDNATVSQIGSGLGTFSSQISGLSSGSVYYIRAYSKSLAGTAYGAQESFVTN